uniref:Cyclin E2 n=1 Tax=Equus asinus asinus TaxID=83772 RepID=A0A8C4PGV1_EQUAS
MSRRSSRLQAKQQPQPNQTDSPQEAQIIQAKKRKTAQDVKKRKEEVTKKHQYEIRLGMFNGCLAKHVKKRDQIRS